MTTRSGSGDVRAACPVGTQAQLVEACFPHLDVAGLLKHRAGGGNLSLVDLQGRGHVRHARGTSQPVKMVKNVVLDPAAVA